jgi:hypothetical protein
VSKPDSGLVASLVYGTSTYQAAARQIDSQGAEIERLRRALKARGPVSDPPVYSNYQPRRRFEQTES